MADEEFLKTRIHTFVLDPDTFFHELAAQPPRYRWPLLIVLVAGIFYAVSACLLTGWIYSLIPVEFSHAIPSYHISPPGSVIGTDNVSFALLVSVPFLMTIFASVVFYFHAALFTSKRGGLLSLLAAVGWGMVPLAVYYLLQIPVFLAFRPGISVTILSDYNTVINTSASLPFAEKQAVAQMLVFSESYYLFIMVLLIMHILAWLCCAWFWIPAVRNTCNVEKRQAAFIVLVPLLIYLVYTFGPILIAAGHGL
jgi:hypothetical protein